MKIPLASPDIEQALEHFVLLTLLHNAYAITLAIIGAVALAWSLYKPSRAKILIFTGALLLLIEFEYSKHIVHGLLEQTLITVTTETPRYRFIWIMEKIITKGIPLALMLSGIASISLGTILGIQEGRKKKKGRGISPSHAQEPQHG